jgi:hypothetical protein
MARVRRADELPLGRAMPPPLLPEELPIRMLFRENSLAGVLKLGCLEAVLSLPIAVRTHRRAGSGIPAGQMQSQTHFVHRHSYSRGIRQA